MIDDVLETARALARDELRPVALRYDESEQYPLELVRRAARVGLTCYDLPATYGGGGLDSLAGVCLVLEELAWGDSPITWVITQGSFFAARCSRSARRSRSGAGCPPLTGREPPVCSVAITGPRGRLRRRRAPDARTPRRRWLRDRGHKRLIGNAPTADLCLVFATVEPGSRSKGSRHSLSRQATTASAAARPCRSPGAAAIPPESSISSRARR